ncbi:MAG: sialidase family protein, partial [Kibdelosporangium sp.]
MSRRLTALVTLGMLLGGNAYAGDGPARVSGPTPFEAGCAGETGPDTLYGNAEVQPHLAVNPRDPRHLLGTYQQDRWSGVAAQGVLTAASFDGGRTWRRSTAPVSECTGGTAGNGGDYKRATDSWVSISPDGTAHLATMSMTGGILEPGSETGIMVSRSADGGVTWGSTRTVIREGPPGFDDLPAVTADPADSRFVYLVWTRIRLLDETRFEGPAYLVRSTDGGRTWEPPQSIHHPGVNAQTVANKIVVLADGTLV